MLHCVAAVFLMVLGGGHVAALDADASISEEDAAGMFKVFDSDGSAGVSFEEIMASVWDGEDEEFQHRVAAYFELHDIDGDGLLTMSETKQFLNAVAKDREF